MGSVCWLVGCRLRFTGTMDEFGRSRFVSVL